MMVFDLLAADFRSALPGCGMDHNQETIKRGSARLRQLDQRGGEGVAGHAGVDELLRENDGRPHGFGDDLGKQSLLRSEVAIDKHRCDASASRDLPHADAVISRLRKGAPRRNENRLAGGGGVSVSFAKTRSICIFNSLASHSSIQYLLDQNSISA